MTFDDAIGWVTTNAGAIINNAEEYLQYTPYDREDLISCANQAAITAVFASQETNGIKFEALFWNNFRALLRELVPCPQNHRWSKSVPSNVCVDIEEIAIADPLSEQPEVSAALLSESVFWAGYEHLTPIERRLLYNLLGIGRAGYHTYEEASAKLGLTKSSAYSMFERACEKLSRAFSLGLSSIDDLPASMTIGELESSMDPHLSVVA
ncbi:hypothetical protein A2G06_16540 (plasmid) [Geobacter anodireducens]|nr:hypothetical protein A2G06_16540 [Geobacter anodireducens]